MNWDERRREVEGFAWLLLMPSIVLIKLFSTSRRARRMQLHWHEALQHREFLSSFRHQLHIYIIINMYAFQKPLVTSFIIHPSIHIRCRSKWKCNCGAAFFPSTSLLSSLFFSLFSFSSNSICLLSTSTDAERDDEEEISVIEMKIFHSGQFEMEIERMNEMMTKRGKNMLQTCLQFP